MKSASPVDTYSGSEWVQPGSYRAVTRPPCFYARTTGFVLVSVAVWVRAARPCRAGQVHHVSWMASVPEAEVDDAN